MHFGKRKEERGGGRLLPENPVCERGVRCAKMSGVSAKSLEKGKASLPRGGGDLGDPWPQVALRLLWSRASPQGLLQWGTGWGGCAPDLSQPVPRAAGGWGSWPLSGP